MKVSIYIPNNRAALYESAKQQLGESISSTFVRCLEQALQAHKAQPSRIVVDIQDPETGRVARKAFQGVWLVGTDAKPLWYEFDEEFRGGGWFAVAKTKQERLVVLYKPRADDWYFSDMQVYDDFDEFENASDGPYERHPAGLIAAVSGALGLKDGIEELDI